ILVLNPWILRSPNRQVFEGPLVLAAPRCTGPRFECRPTGHAIQPVAKQFWFANRTGFADEDQKSGLESILGSVPVMQQPPAHTPDHAAVTLHESRAGRRLARRREAL